MASMQIPNSNPGGNREGSTAPLGGSRGAVHGPNQSDPGDRRGGTMPLGGSASPMNPPNEQPHPPGHSSQPMGS